MGLQELSPPSFGSAKGGPGPSTAAQTVPLTADTSGIAPGDKTFAEAAVPGEK